MPYKWPLVAVAGKFQPLHNEHLEYLLAAVKLGEHVLVGITNPDPTYVREEALDPNRSRDSSNPFTFYERMRMVQESLSDAAVRAERYSVVPFPVNVPDSWFCYMPRDAVFLLTMYDDDPWLATRKARLESYGFETHVLWRRASKGLTATAVRSLMRADGEWRALVPAGTSRVVDQLGLAGRVREQASAE